MLARASEYLPEIIVLSQSRLSPGKPRSMSPKLVWLCFLPQACRGNQGHHTCISAEPPIQPILQRRKPRLKEQRVLPRWQSGYSSLAISVPQTHVPPATPGPLWLQQHREGLCHPGALGDSLLSLLVELLAELQWRNTMLLPVLVVGLQDLTVKLLGSCSDFKMENVSGQRKHPPKV